MNGVAYPAFIIPTAKHTGHRRNAKLLNIFTGVEMVFYIHDHLRFFAMNHKFIRARHAGAVQQSVNGKRSIARLRGVKPECGEVRELFLTVSIGIYRQPASRQAILISIIYRPEITGARKETTSRRASSGALKTRKPAKPRSLCPSSCVVSTPASLYLNSSGRK